MLQTPGRELSSSRAANRHGQQLFFANIGGNRRTPHHHLEPPTTTRRRAASNLPPLPRLSRITVGQNFEPVTWRQLRFFDVEPDLSRSQPGGDSADSHLLRYCDEVVRDHAAVHGWSRKQTNDVRRTLRLLPVFQDTPGAKVNATDVLRLPRLQGNLSAISTIDVLASAGLLIDDRTSPVERYFTKQIAGLPAPMTAQLRLWFDVMINGSTTSPRRRPRDPATAKLHIRASHRSCESGLPRATTLWPRSMQHHVLARRCPPPVPAGTPRTRPSVGLRRSEVPEGDLHRPHPRRRSHRHQQQRPAAAGRGGDQGRARLARSRRRAPAAVALVAFHAITSRQVRVVEAHRHHRRPAHHRQPHLPPRRPVLPRLAAWLDHRARTWPATQNPHLFVNRRTAPRLTPVSPTLPLETGRSPTPNPPARTESSTRSAPPAATSTTICHLFGLTVDGSPPLHQNRSTSPIQAHRRPPRVPKPEGRATVRFTVHPRVPS